MTMDVNFSASYQITVALCFPFQNFSCQVNDLLLVYEAYLETKTVHSMMTALACPVPEAPDGGWKKVAAVRMAHATGSLQGHFHGFCFQR